MTFWYSPSGFTMLSWPNRVFISFRHLNHELASTGENLSPPKKHVRNVNWRWPELFVKQHVVESATKNSVNLAWLHHVHSAKRHQFLLQGAFVQPMVFVHPSAFFHLHGRFGFIPLRLGHCFHVLPFFFWWAVKNSSTKMPLLPSLLEATYISFSYHTCSWKGPFFHLKGSF